MKATITKADTDKKQLETKLQATVEKASTDKKQLEATLKAAVSKAGEDHKQLERLQTAVDEASADKKQLQTALETALSSAEERQKKLQVALQAMADKDKELQAVREDRDLLEDDVQYFEEYIRTWDANNKATIEEWKDRYYKLANSLGKPGKMLADLTRQLVDSNKLLEQWSAGDAREDQ